MISPIKVSVRELHARTGHYIRKAAGRQRVIVTDHGKPIAELAPFRQERETPFFARRVLRPDFQKASEAGAFRPSAQHRDITELISEGRN